MCHLSCVSCVVVSGYSLVSWWQNDWQWDCERLRAQLAKWPVTIAWKLQQLKYSIVIVVGHVSHPYVEPVHCRRPRFPDCRCTSLEHCRWMFGHPALYQLSSVGSRPSSSHEASLTDATAWIFVTFVRWPRSFGFIIYSFYYYWYLSLNLCHLHFPKFLEFSTEKNLGNDKTLEIPELGSLRTLACHISHIPKREWVSEWVEFNAPPDTIERLDIAFQFGLNTRELCFVPMKNPSLLIYICFKPSGSVSLLQGRKINKNNANS